MGENAVVETRPPAKNGTFHCYSWTQLTSSESNEIDAPTGKRSDPRSIRNSEHVVFWTCERLRLGRPPSLRV